MTKVAITLLGRATVDAPFEELASSTVVAGDTAVAAAVRSDFHRLSEQSCCCRSSTYVESKYRCSKAFGSAEQRGSICRGWLSASLSGL